MRRYTTPIFSIFALLIVCSLLLIPFASGVQAAQKVPDSWQKGAILLNFGPDPYRPASREAIGALAAAGGNWVALSPIWYMDTRLSNSIYPNEKIASPSDFSVVRSIGWAHERGLKVMLKPYFDVRDLTWRAEITPQDPDAWWDSYRAFIFHYADIAAANGAEELTIGTELINMTRGEYTDRWLELIADLRLRYNGLLTYSANWGKRDGEYQTISWWDRLDFIGISSYFPISLAADPSVDDLVRGWTGFTDAFGQRYNWVEDIAAVQRRVGKPVLFTEIGYGSYSNTAGRWDVVESEQLSLEAQRRAYEATLRVWSEQPWFAGMFWWYWDSDPPADVAQKTGQTPRRKPAELVLADWYGGAAVATPVPLPTVTPTAVPVPFRPDLPNDAPLAPGPVSPSPYAGHAAFDAIAPFDDSADRIYLAPTGHSLGGDFLRYWRDNGGLDLFGYPISEPFSEQSPTDGQVYTVQWFERNRFELHPENEPPYRVSLGLLGVQLAVGRQDPPFRPATFVADKRYFSETSHSLGGGFLAAWEARGGLPIFGYPLSEEFAERSATDGKVYLVQYFERARFEYHPDNLGTVQSVQLGLLGRIVTGR